MVKHWVLVSAGMAILFQTPLAATPLLRVNYTATGANGCAMNGVAGAIGTGNIQGTVQNSQGPLSGSISCGGPNNYSVSATATASYGAVEIGAVMTGIGIFDVSASQTDTITISSADLPVGTELRVTVPFVETGSFTYSGLNLTVNALVNASLGGATIVNDSFGSVFDCNNHLCSGSGSLNRTFGSAPIMLKVGQAYAFALGFEAVLDNGVTTGIINLGDPSIPYFQVNDPVTGALISDVTIQGDSGTMYAVNSAPSSVPEPSALAQMGLGLFSFTKLLTRRSR